MRRWIFLLASAGTAAALSLGLYLPQYFSPVPGLVAELKSCLEPSCDDAQDVDPDSGAGPSVQIELLIAGFNTTKAGMILLADAENEGEAVRGTVKDDRRLRSALEHLRAAGFISIISRPTVGATSGSQGYVMIGQEIRVVSVVDGVTSVEHKQCGLKAEALPTRLKNGQIHLQLNVTLSEPKWLVNGPSGASLNLAFEVAEANISIVLTMGQSCFIGGLMRKSIATKDYRLPLASDLPGIGSWFQFRRRVEIDEELFILATLKPAAWPYAIEP